MATIGLDKLYYAKITEDANGNETYGTPVQLAKAIDADLSIELLEATLYADDGTDTVIKEFKSGKLTLGTRKPSTPSSSAVSTWTTRWKTSTARFTASPPASAPSTT